MRYAIFSDAHSNLEALEKVLDEVRRDGPDRTIFLGDAVGYGPDPNEVIELLAGQCDLWLAGNHDWAALERIDPEEFNPHAREAILWTQKVLTPTNRERLQGRALEWAEGKLRGVHATPREPEQWHYLLGLEDAARNFQCFSEKACFIGHSHEPLLLERDPTGAIHLHPKEEALTLREGCRYLINVGSVGQPRDGDPRACYLLYDSESQTLQLKRVEYDIPRVQEKMRRQGLPRYLVERLAQGR
ncbi:MAG: metallophosphoesterase family protein [Candidatus Tectomicrobia bacterium]|uniref:Metallophosphoesterase family protein n=1 Tax=Tectimicrobiota bacterium TaxID=2528274 RepID=A0A932CN61_UNCTE|nr:metallophosphoesterase family protein [Candidatus Tectomicrobia bacterium]